MKPITKLYAWIARDAYGEEGICSWFDGAAQKWMPMIHPDRERMEGAREMAMLIHNEGQFPIRLAVFKLEQTLEKYP
jgi:hypothetical protein